MPGVVRQGDNCSGHSCYPPRAATSGSPDVFVNGLPVHRVGDNWAAHACPDTPPHSGTMANGSATVFVNGQPIARIGDAVDCGSTAAQGSDNVLAG